MQFALKVCVLLVGLMPHSFAEIDFIDCGSDQIDVNKVLIDECDHTPCYIRRGHPYNVVITPDFLDPQIDNVDLAVSAIIRGAVFNVNASFVEPCGLPCPIEDRVISPNIPINVEMPHTLLRGPAPLVINATYMNGKVRRSHFCIEFDIYIY